MTRYAVAGTTRAEREWNANRLCGRASQMLRACAIDWTPDPPELVFTPDLTSAELAFLATIPTTAGPSLAMTGANPAGATGGAHPDEATHVTLGLVPNTDSRLTDARTPLSHTHAYSATGHGHVEADVTALAGDLVGKAAAVHTHAEADTTSLVTDLAAKAALSHSHIDSDLPAGLARDAEVAAGYSAIGHTHVGGSVDIVEAEVDFGTYPRSDGVFTVTDVLVTPATQLLAYQSGTAATGKDADDNELDAISVRAVAKSGSFTVYADALTGPVSGRFVIAYLRG